MTGIYKITSPTGRVYIGQAVDIEKRWRKYSKLKCELQVRLYRSFIKYGVENHTFEVIEECIVEQLNEKERFWQDKHSVLTSKGLNCLLTKSSESPQIFSKQTKNKIARANKGSRNAMYGKRGSDHPAFGGKYNGMRGRQHSISTRIKMSQSRQKWSFSKETVEKFSSNYSKGNNPKAKQVIDTKTGIIYDSALEAAISINMGAQSLRKRLNGIYVNNTNFKFLQND